MDASEQRTIGKSGIAVTRLGFGGAPLGNLFSAVDEADAVGALSAAYQSGTRYFDTAPLYGHGLSEKRMGRVLGACARESFVLSSKVGRLLRAVEGSADGGNYVEVLQNKIDYDYSYNGAMRSLESSLSRLGLDRIDILYIHDIDVMTHGPAEQKRRYREAMEGAYRALDRLRGEKTVKAIGLGVNEWEVCEQAAKDGEFDCFLLAGQYSLLKQDALDRFLPLCAERGIELVIGGPYNSGILATGAVEDAKYFYKPAPAEILERTRRIEGVCARHGVPLATAALQFPLHHPVVASVIPGARSEAEFLQNKAHLERAVPSDLWNELKAEGLLRSDAPIMS